MARDTITLYICIVVVLPCKMAVNVSKHTVLLVTHYNLVRINPFTKAHKRHMENLSSKSTPGCASCLCSLVVSMLGFCTVRTFSWEEKTSVLKFRIPCSHVIFERKNALFFSCDRLKGWYMCCDVEVSHRKKSWFKIQYFINTSYFKNYFINFVCIWTCCRHFW